jgi:hypothetical protein
VYLLFIYADIVYPSKTDNRYILKLLTQKVYVETLHKFVQEPVLKMQIGMLTISTKSLVKLQERLAIS